MPSRHLARDVDDVLERVERRLRRVLAIAVGELLEGAVLGIAVEQMPAGADRFVDALSDLLLEFGGHDHIVAMSRLRRSR